MCSRPGILLRFFLWKAHQGHDFVILYITFASSVSNWAILGSSGAPDVGVGAVGGGEFGPAWGNAVWK